MSPMPDDPAAAAGEYRAAHADAVLTDRSELGRLEITGKDALDLLHRLTTNDVRPLQPGQGTTAAFLTGKGRIVDLVTLHRLEDRLLCLTGPGRGAAVAAYIDRYTFREEVRVEDRGRSHGILGIFGARASGRVALLFGREAAGLPLHHSVATAIDGLTVLLARAFPLAGDGYHLIAAAGDLPALRLAILRRAEGLAEAGPVCMEVLRIETGQPAAGRELTEDYNPWEARLDEAISLTKGCYVGQEVVARLNTYRKVTKLLARIRVDGGLPVPGARLESAGQPIGILTSAARIPGEERAVALGYVRDEDAAPGKEIDVVDGDRRLRAAILEPAR